jgi:signal transduction histidine kinase
VRHRRWIGWAVYLVSVIIVLDVLGFVTWTMLKFERADLEAAAESDLQERVRLSLWRMDSFMAPIIAQESARPYFHYRAFYPAERAYTRMWEEVRPGDVLVPSPLLLASKMGSATGGLIRLHFQIEPGGGVTSPQVPDGNMLDLAESKLGLANQVARAEGLLEQLRVYVDQSPRLAESSPAAGMPASALGQVAQLASNLKSGQEFEERRRTLRLSPDFSDKDQTAPRADQKLQAASTASGMKSMKLEKTISIGSFRPIWVQGQPEHPGTELMFLRSVTLDGKSFRQGIWIDWPMLRRLMLSYVLDLLPDARLEPIEAAGSDDTETAWMLASLPARLVPGDQPPLPPIGFSWTRQILVVTWIAVLSAVIAIGLVLRASIRLSDRRGRFVSAVTHELRTPLTTFCLYTEMLADGVVTDEPTRQTYLGTLKSESRRLAGIVENVLAYARLDRPHSANAPHVDARDLIEALEPIMRRRIDDADGTLSLEVEPTAFEQTIEANTESVQRIVMNLIENACKYGHAEGEYPRIEVAITASADAVSISVRDHGPGIPKSEIPRIFTAFHRGPDQGSHAQPGLGLGLALARGLARELGGDLYLEPVGGSGVRFVLRLRAS